MTSKQAAIKIIRRLNRNGFQALLAGGCVRDMLLCRKAGDYDVATNAQPDDVMKLFKRTIRVGAKFGVVIVLLEDLKVEVATFRTETGYADGRHPSVVKFSSAEEDASRRDFTINGMFYDPLKNKVIDYVDGKADLKKRLIRTIGKPNERFDEDYLRMLRAVRFSTQLGFEIQPATWSAIRENAKKITKISGERIAIELEAILVNPNRSKGASMLAKSGLAESIFPGFSVRNAEFAVNVLGQLRKKVDFALAIASLFAGCPTEFALEKCRVLKLSRNQNKHIKFLLTNRGKLLEEQMPLSRLKLVLSEPYFWDLYELQRAILKALPDGKAGIVALNGLRKRIKDLGDVELRPKPLLSGHELIRLGAIPGPTLGQLAQELYITQLEGKLHNSKQARQWVQDWLQKHRAIE